MGKTLWFGAGLGGGARPPGKPPKRGKKKKQHPGGGGGGDLFGNPPKKNILCFGGGRFFPLQGRDREGQKSPQALKKLKHGGGGQKKSTALRGRGGAGSQKKLF